MIPKGLRTRENAETHWRFSLVKECIGIITITEGQCVENRALSKMVGHDPRALRNVLQNFEQIRIMIDPNGKRGLWYGLNPDAPKLVIPGNIPLPPGAIAVEHKETERIAFVEGEE